MRYNVNLLICFHFGRVNVSVIVMAQSKTRSPQTLFVINFDPNRSRVSDIERHFKPYVSLHNVQIRRNFAFVQYETQEDATKALECTDMRSVSHWWDCNIISYNPKFPILTCTINNEFLIIALAVRYWIGCCLWSMLWGMIVVGSTIMVAVPEEEGVLLDLPVQVIAGDQVQTMVVHVVLCMILIGIVDRTCGGVLIIAGTGVLNMADTAGVVFEVNFTYLLQLHSFFELIYSFMYLQSFTSAKVEN